MERTCTCKEKSKDKAELINWRYWEIWLSVPVGKYLMLLLVILMLTGKVLDVDISDFDDSSHCDSSSWQQWFFYCFSKICQLFYLTWVFKTHFVPGMWRSVTSFFFLKYSIPDNFYLCLLCFSCCLNIIWFYLYFFILTHQY